MSCARRSEAAVAARVYANRSSIAAGQSRELMERLTKDGRSVAAETIRRRIYRRTHLDSSRAHDRKAYDRRKRNPMWTENRKLNALQERIALKRDVMSHYGPDGEVRCSWIGCNVCDLDMLTLDHIKNDGKWDRTQNRRAVGSNLYRRLRRENYPEGFQTLCANHQLKKKVEFERQNPNHGRRKTDA
jgi:hypothetical protein